MCDTPNKLRSLLLPEIENAADYKAAPEVLKVAVGLTPIAQGGQATVAGLIASGNTAVKAGGNFSTFRTLLTGTSDGLDAGGHRIAVS